jgi:hypothetical protein
VGYQELPTRKVNPGIIPLVALLPQVGQIAFGFYYAQDTKRRWAGTVTVILFLWDFLTDVYYKSAGFSGLRITAIASLESFALFTIGSELAMTVAIGMVFELFKPFIVRIVGLLGDLMGVVTHLAGVATGGNDDNE